MNKEKEIIQPYYIIDINTREIVTYGVNIQEAALRYALESEKTTSTIVMVKPVTWKTEVTDITGIALDEVQPNE